MLLPPLYQRMCVLVFYGGLHLGSWQNTLKKQGLVHATLRDGPHEQVLLHWWMHAIIPINLSGLAPGYGLTYIVMLINLVGEHTSENLHNMPWWCVIITSDITLGGLQIGLPFIPLGVYLPLSAVMGLWTHAGKQVQVGRVWIRPQRHLPPKTHTQWVQRVFIFK